MRIIFTLLLFIVIGGIHAQNEGVIIYNEKIDIHRRLPEDRQQYKDMIPQFRTSKFELYYKDKESMYIVSKDQEVDETRGPGGGPRFRMGNASRDVYKKPR